MERKMEIGFIEKLDIDSIIKDVLRQWWVILVLSLSISFVVDIWATENYKPRYETTATFAVTANGLNNNIYQNLTTTKELAARFSKIINSNVMEKKVAEELGKETSEALARVEQIPETNLLIFTISAETAMEAYHTIDIVLNNYNKVSDYVIENVILEMIEQPLIPVEPTNSWDEIEILVVSFVLAVIALCIFFACLSFFRDTIKNPEEFIKKIDAPLLGVIYHEKNVKRKDKKNRSMLIQNPLRSFQFVESNKLMATKVRSRLEKEEKKIVLITSVMENEGKSTIAANLALALAQEHKEVLLIDCDFRKPSQYKIFDLPKEENINLPNILKDGDEPLQVWRWDDNFYTVFNSVATSNITDVVDSEHLKNVLEYFSGQMDFIIIDTSPLGLVSDVEELAQAADASIVVVSQDKILTRDINDAVDILNNTRAKVLGCVFNNATLAKFETRNDYGYGNEYGYGAYYGK